MDISEKIKSVDIRQIIEKETGLKFKSSGGTSVLKYCPFCGSGKGEKGTSAFSVKDSKNFFNCFSCGNKGTAIDFVIAHKDFNNKSAIDYLAKKYSDLPQFEPQPEIKTDLSKTIYAITKNSIQKATEYLQSRKIETEKLPQNSYLYDSYSNSIVFIDTEAKLINKRLFEPEKDKPKVMQAKGSVLKNALYDKTYNQKNETVFLTESVINALSLFPYSSLSIFSASNRFTRAKKLSKYLTGKNVVLAFDNDVKPDKKNDGKECTEYYTKFILDNIEVKSLSSLIMPENIDINDLLQKDELSDFVKDTDNYNFIEIDILKKPLLQNSKSPNQDFEKLGFFVKDSQYFIKKFTAKRVISEDISDCIINILYKLNNDDGTRLVKVQQTEIDGTQRRELLELTSDELSKDKFRTELLKKSCNFYGTQPNLDRIIKYNTHREKEAEIIETYGWHPESNMFILSDCAINTNNLLTKPNSIGMVTDDKSKKLYYVPAASPANLKSEKIFREQFYYKEGDVNFKRFAKLFYLSNKLNGSIGTMFYLLSLYRDIVVTHLDFFPYLFLYGTAGGGKTSYAEILTGLFGDMSKGIDLKNVSQAGLSRVASQKMNTINYYKEYKTDAAPYVEQYFKAGYDCVSRTIADGASKNTTTFEIKSSGLLDSNFLPTNEEAVFSRMIILDFEKANFTNEQKEAFFEIKDHKEKGLTQITKEVLQYRSLFEDNFKDVYYTVLDNIKNGKMKNFKDRERAFKHVALILTPFHIFNETLDFPFDIEELEDIMIEHAEEQYKKLTEFQSTSVFWQSVAYWKNEGKVKEFGEANNKNKAHYVKKQLTDTTGIIYLKSTRLNDLHMFYANYCKSKGIPYDSNTELKSKLITTGYAPYIPNSSQKKKVVNNTYLGSSYAFDYTINKIDKNIIIDDTEYEL